MKSLVLCFAAALSAVLIHSQECDSQAPPDGDALTLAVAFNDAGLTDIVPTPDALLGVEFPDATVNLGNLILPSLTLVKPTQFTYADADPNTNYTYLVINVDVPSRSAPVLRSYLLALCVNINGTDLNNDKGVSIAPYIGPLPYPGSGPHRIVLMLFEQPGVIDTNNRTLVLLGVNRYQFNVTEFASNYTLGNPVAGNFWQSESPSECNACCLNTICDD